MNGWRGRAADIFTKHGESRQKRSPPRGLTSRISSYSTTPYPTNGDPMTFILWAVIKRRKGPDPRITKM